MAKQTQTLLIDDLDGSEAAETIHFGIDSAMNFEIDLSDANASRFRAFLAPYIEKARRVPTTTYRPARAHRNNRSFTRKESMKIREWLTEAGYDVPLRGRLAADLVDAYMSQRPAPSSQPEPEPQPDPMAEFRPADGDTEDVLEAKFVAWVISVKGKKPIGKQRSANSTMRKEWLKATNLDS
jgi:hypothetical protein